MSYLSKAALVGCVAFTMLNIAAMNLNEVAVVAKDPELASIIRENSIDKSAIENSRVEFTITGGKFIPLLNFPTYTTIKNGSITIAIQQMPVLSQRQYYGIRPEIMTKVPIIALPSNYCGDYAAYNLWCIVTKQPNNIRNRKLFAEHFRSMLAIIKKNDLKKIESEGFALSPEIHKKPYDNLAGYEIEYLLKQEFKIDPSQYLVLGIFKEKIMSASENFDAVDKRNKLLEAFRSGPFEQEKILGILFRVGINHWIAIKAVRKDNMLTFEIYDSSGTRNWQDTYETTPINADILKILGIYLTTPGMT